MKLKINGPTKHMDPLILGGNVTFPSPLIMPIKAYFNSQRGFLQKWAVPNNLESSKLTKKNQGPPVQTVI